MRGRRRASEKKARASKASIVDFPNLERIINAEPQIAQVMADISRHYGATQAVLTWRSAGFLHCKSDSHSEVSCSAVVPDSQLFNHTLTRRLPIIVGDASVIGSAQPLPSLVSKPRFYAAAPLVLQSGMYVGTLCFVDSDATRPSFSLADASFLERKAAEVAGVLQGYVNKDAWECNDKPDRFAAEQLPAKADREHDALLSLDWTGLARRAV